MSSSKTFDLILEHDHGKVKAAKLPRIHSVRKWVTRFVWETFALWAGNTKDNLGLAGEAKLICHTLLGKWKYASLQVCKSASLQVCKSASLQAKAATVKGIYRTKK